MASLETITINDLKDAIVTLDGRIAKVSSDNLRLQGKVPEAKGIRGFRCPDTYESLSMILLNLDTKLTEEERLNVELRKVDSTKRVSDNLVDAILVMTKRGI